MQNLKVRTVKLLICQVMILTQIDSIRHIFNVDGLKKRKVA